MRLRFRLPRELGQLLLSLARLRPREVEEYLDRRPDEWEALAEASPYDAADILGELGEEAATGLLTELEPAEAADVLEELPAGYAAEILEELEPSEAASLLEQMTREGATDVLAELEDETRRELLGLVEPETADEVRQLLLHPADSAGGLMTTDVASLPIGLTAGEAIERIRQLHEEFEDLSYVYIVDDDNRLVGVLSFRDLVFRRPGEGLDEAMVHDPISVRTDTDREQLAELIQRYHLFGLPVVDEDGRLMGRVSTDAVIEAVRDEASEDFAAAVGAGIEETVHSPLRRSVRSRLPWLGFDVLISTSVVFAVSRFESLLDTFTVLAALMPLVARLGGDAGAQSLAVVIRGLASGDLPIAAGGRVIRRQVTIGLVNGVAVGVLSGLLGMAVQTALGGGDILRIGVVMAIGAWANLVLAGLAGSGIPLLLRKLGFDPALGSNLLLTTLTDLLGFAGFLFVATLLL